MSNWGVQERSLPLVDPQSRRDPASGCPGCNVIWLAADLERRNDHKLRPVRRGVAQQGRRVAEAIIRAYGQQSASSDSSLRSPYLPVHTVRAQAAFETGVTRALVDIVLAKLADGEYPDVAHRFFSTMATAVYDAFLHDPHARGGEPRSAYDSLRLEQ
jgi:hypothetical protein